MKKQKKECNGETKLNPIRGSRAIRKIFSLCPLSPGRTRKVLTKFNSEAAFFRTCLGKQKQVRMYGDSRMRGLSGSDRLNTACGRCKQGKASRSRKVVVDLAGIGIGIDPGMGVGR